MPDLAEHIHLIQTTELIEVSFADTGIPLLPQRAFQLGAAQSGLVIVRGEFPMLDPNGTFDIGQRSHLAMKQTFSRTGIRVSRECTGGTRARLIGVEIASDHVKLGMAGHAGRDLRIGGGTPCRS